MIITRYTPDDRAKWDDFIDRSRNATFLHKRGYMDYHADRFTDCSLMAWNDKGKLCALLPANIEGSTLCSHRGLTFGGWLTAYKDSNAINMLDIFESAAQYLRSIGVDTLIYKAIPYIYCRYPSQEDIYALFRMGAQIDCVLIANTIDLREPYHFNRSTRLNINHAKSLHLQIREEQDYRPYWQLLESVLLKHHDSSPVHTLEEITLLHERFPANIRLFTLSLDDRLLGGTVIYDTGITAHTQYIAIDDEGRELCALPYLFDSLIRDTFANRHFFDLGTSNEDHGRVINAGLVRQKAGLGGRGVAYVTYRLSL